MGRRSTSLQVTLVNLALICCSILLPVSARRGASPPSSSKSTADQLTKLGQKSTGQVLETATHITGKTIQEGQRQVGNLGEAAQIAGSPIVSGVTNEGTALLNVARVLGLPGLEDMLTGQMGDTKEPDEDTSDPGSPTAPESGENTDFGGDTEPKSEETSDMPPATPSTPAVDEDLSTGQAPQEPEAQQAAPAPTEENRVASAPAPAPQRLAKQKDKGAWTVASGAPTAAPEVWDNNVPEPEFMGKPLERTEADVEDYKAQMARRAEKKYAGTADKEAKGETDDDLPFPVYYLDQLKNVDDKQARKIFHRGTGEVPSAISAKNFAYCDLTLPLTQSFQRPQAWPRIKWPEADEIFHTLSRLVWEGKFFVTDPKTKASRVFNILFLDDNVGAIANVTALKKGYFPDERPSFIVDYSPSDFVPLRISYDEFRRVGPTIYLGYGIMWMDGRGIIPEYATGVEKAALDALKPVANATFAALLNAQKVVRRFRNMSSWTNIDVPPEGAIPTSFWFAVDCQDYRIPGLHYTPILADAAANLELILGYDAPYYRLPQPPGPYTDTKWDQSKGKYAAPPFVLGPKAGPEGDIDAEAEGENDAQAEAESESIAGIEEETKAYPTDMNNPASGIKFASPEDEVIVKPYALFPIYVPANETTGTKASSGFVKLPAATLEPAFGSFWEAEGQYQE